VGAVVTKMRVRLAVSEADRELHTHLEAAQRCLGKAANSCGRVVNVNKRRGAESRRAKNAQVTINRALSLINSIGYLTPRIDHSERDMLSEDQLSEIARSERVARDEARAQKVQGADAQQGSE